ncbi:hypothetical protein SOVF_006800 [Spinacia oleracea]|uniref:Glycosyltransferase n=1 Tax=Spinacia oleracea TaxID=3562 RepID=A0A9R0HZQ5_SPIOL|nr:anthocyanidin 3-O-glucosyltransferase 2-like [Spinacia oleracea]KNA25404.1 hypothetical protein SOVF_006800 [Spinacia oleracea]
MSKAELVLIPTPGTGHLISAVEFAKLIIKHDQRISILVIIFHIPIHSTTTKVNTYIESQSLAVDPQRITFLTLPSLPDSDIPDPASSNFFNNMVQLQKPLVKQAIMDRLIKPVAFVFDLMCVNLVDIAKEFQLPCYVYFTAGASLLNLMFHFQALFDDHGIDISTAYSNLSDNVGLGLDLPGFRNRVPAKVLPSSLFDKDSGFAMFFNHLSRKFRETDGILVNTFMELEPGIIQCLQEQDKIPEVYPVGPILALHDDNNGGDREPVMRWLDEQPDSSVVFLCFGSMGSFDEDQVREIANGLDRSGQRFLWALRRPISESSYVLPSENETFEDALPPGFLDRTAHRGKIIGWAPQVQVLAHRAVGGFVSHCGWNSILEAIWFGVPIATWPMYSEQQINAFEMVKEVQVAVEIRMDYQRNLMNKDANFMVTSSEVENGVKKLMSMDDAMRGRISKMKNISREVLECDGSSYTSFTCFISKVLQSVGDQ